MCGANPFGTLPAGLLSGSIVVSRESGRPIIWVSDDSGPAVQKCWERLYYDHPRTGLYPLLVDDCLDIDLMLGTPVTVEDIDATPGERLIREYFEYFGDDWPGFVPARRLGAPPGYPAGRLAVEGASDYRLALVPCARGADAPGLIGWSGAANYTVNIEKISAVLRTWEDRFGVRVVKLGCSTVELSVAAPPRTISEARRITLEHSGFCPSIWRDHVTLEGYASRLLRQPAWRFHWA
jgi:hypothetical protein